MVVRIYLCHKSPASKSVNHTYLFHNWCQHILLHKCNCSHLPNHYMFHVHMDLRSIRRNLQLYNSSQYASCRILDGNYNFISPSRGRPSFYMLAKLYKFIKLPSISISWIIHHYWSCCNISVVDERILEKHMNALFQLKTTQKTSTAFII